MSKRNAMAKKVKGKGKEGVRRKEGQRVRKERNEEVRDRNVDTGREWKGKAGASSGLKTG